MGDVISIIVPIYNVEQYLVRCLESILSQTYSNLQVILVDDGSTDSSGAICDRYKVLDSRVLVVHQSNKGLVAARKKGLEISTGKFVGFVDGDDYIDPDMYACLYEKILETGADIVHAGYKKNDSEETWGIGEEGIYVIDEKSIFDIFCKLLFTSGGTEAISPSIWSKLFRRGVIMEAYGEVPDSQSYGEDLLCLCNALFCSNRITLTVAANYHYVTRSDSITHMNERGKLLKREYRLYEQLCMIFKKKNVYFRYEDIINDFFARNLMFVLRQAAPMSVCCYQYPDIKRIQGQKIVIYGAGIVGQDYYSQFSLYENCYISAWIDEKPWLYGFDYYDIRPIAALKGIEYDIIVVAVLNEQTAEEIVQHLLKNEIKKEKIVWEKPISTIRPKSI